METTPIEKWAGPVAGQTFLETRFRIPRSTLHLWQRRGEVVALRKSARHHVFPLAQFVDSRPVSGLREILSCFLNARLAWLWLVSPASELDGRIPIDMLKEDYVADVVAAARVLASDLAY